MKNGLLIWNVLLTIVTGYLLVSHLTGGKKSDATGRAKNEDSVGINKEFRIAYFEMDSVEAHFEMVKDVKTEMNKKEDGITIELDRLGKDYQNKLMYYQNKQQEMNQQQYEAAAMDLKKLEQNISSRKQTLDQEYNELVMRRMKDVKTKIEDFLKEYNKDKKFSYIVSYEQGLFYYRDTVYNITADVIKGLNDMYKPAKKN